MPGPSAYTDRRLRSRPQAAQRGQKNCWISVSASRVVRFDDRRAKRRVSVEPAYRIVRAGLEEARPRAARQRWHGQGPGKNAFQISGGMQKRVGLARAIALEPGIVLFDEPTTGLDPITGAEIGQLISRLKEKYQMASIVVTHDLHAAKQFSDRVVMLHEGSILVEGTSRTWKRAKTSSWPNS